MEGLWSLMQGMKSGKKNPYFSGAVEAERASFWGFSRIWKADIGLCQVQICNIGNFRGQQNIIAIVVRIGYCSCLGLEFHDYYLFWQLDFLIY